MNYSIKSDLMIVLRLAEKRGPPIGDHDVDVHERTDGE